MKHINSIKYEELSIKKNKKPKMELVYKTFEVLKVESVKKMEEFIMAHTKALIGLRKL